MEGKPEDSSRRMPPRTHSNFMTRSALDNAAQLNRRGSLAIPSPSPGDEAPADRTATGDDGATPPEKHRGSFFPSLFNRVRDKSATAPRPRRSSMEPLLGARRGLKKHSSSDKQTGRTTRTRESSEESAKLGTFGGVFVPTTLNVFSILLFLRFGFVLGQTGLLGFLAMLLACYAINLLTTMSISAIATNGTVRGGGAYYLISRSLGPEFGGSIGILFYLGLLFNTGMNAVGLVDCFVENFGQSNGNWAQWLPESYAFKYLWSTVILVVCTIVCLAGSSVFAKASNALLLILLVATLSIPFSALVVSPFQNTKQGVIYTGISLETLSENLMPRFTRGAAGSQLKHRENFQDLFGILFPATGGIFAGASMSGDLKHPSKAIPKGTLYGLLLTFVTYTLVIISMAATITRASMYRNTNVIQLVNVSEVIVFAGEIATSLFSTLMGVIGSAKLLQALSRDDLFPGLGIFSQGTKKGDEPTYAIIFTYVIAQLTMLADINQIASLVTMSYLMTFLSTNLACFLLKIGSAPNFRPSFHYFSWKTAAVGTIASGATMFFVDGIAASACVVLLIVLFLLVHYTTPPKPWGDVSQSLIYHQVRKYLLRLRQEHVKFWRPQILLLINDPRKQYKLIQFCNSLKKGALYILGHVIVTQDFAGAVPEARRQQASWTKYIDFSHIKAFVNIAISPALEWGARNLVLGAGLGGMRPNIVVMGSYNLTELRETVPLVDLYSSISSHADMPAGKARPLSKRKQKEKEKLSGVMPTDAMRRENAISASSYVTVLEDLLLNLKINVAIAKGFNELDLPNPTPSTTKRLLQSFYLAEKEGQDDDIPERYIDLWPIQMSAITEVDNTSQDGEGKHGVLTTNFDTYTLILQLGCILKTVPSYHRRYTLRIIVFVEYESDVEEERGRVNTLLINLRIQAEVVVLWLASGDLKTYEVIINGSTDGNDADAIRLVDDALSDEDWWHDIQKLRGRRGDLSESQELAGVAGILDAAQQWPEASFQHGRQEQTVARFHGLRKMLRQAKRRSSVGQLSQLGVNLGMRTQRLPASLVSAHDSGSSVASDEESTFADSGSEGYPASENDARLASEPSAEESRPVTPLRRAVTTGSTVDPIPQQSEPETSSEPRDIALGPSISQPQAVSETALLLPSGVHGDLTPPSRTSTPRTQHSLPQFSSKPQPRTKVNEETEQGPSIMFDQPSPTETRAPGPSIYDRTTRAALNTMPSGTTTSSGSSFTASSASGFPAPQSVPLSFNDLPCRAQHLILNELISQQSENTGIVFTTLPCPAKDTGQSEADSIRFLSDLEVLTHGLPPVLLVHSNSLTVTMNL